MRRYLELKRTRPVRQRRLPFYERSRRHQRRFKLGVIAVTSLALCGILAAFPKGRYLVGTVPSLTRHAARAIMGLPTPREEVDAAWRRYRLQGIEDSHRALTGFYAKAEPAYQRLMRYAGLDPDHGLLRWGNYRLTILFPSTVFEADETGRSLRLRPCTKSIWLRELTLRAEIMMVFLVPDGPGLSEAIRGTTAIVINESMQTTNSWGLRGPEPELDAPLRGIVLGDSFMLGMFIGDNDAPPECLRRDLEKRCKTRVSILNTGCLGYSPEQYYHSLVAFADRFRPQFIVVSICSNDFGEPFEVLQGNGEWDEGKYWLDRIALFARSRHVPALMVPIPHITQMVVRRKTGFFPGALTNTLDLSGLHFLDPTDAFVDAHLELISEGRRRGQRPDSYSLFNEKYLDGHFSALGSEVWAKAVGRRISLLLRRHQASDPGANPGD
jgi:hypothetical protein